MRLLLGAAAVGLLLLLLTWLLLRGTEGDTTGYALALQAFDDFALAEATLHRDILRARAGLLRNYDPLVTASDKIDDAVVRLRLQAHELGLDTKPIDRLATTMAQQRALTEHFKTSNALLQNSLSYFGLLSTSQDYLGPDTQLAPATSALAAAILHLTLDTSPAAARAAQDRLDHLAIRATAEGHTQATEVLLAHARLLHELLPAVDEILKKLLAMPSKQHLEVIRELFAGQHKVAQITAQRFRLLLYLTSLLLLLTLVHLGLRLRARALASRRRAALEHVIAANSTRLINCPPAETDKRIKQVLGDLGREIGVERVYVVLEEHPVRMHIWSADRTAYPPGWPEGALTLFAQLGKGGRDLVTVPDTAMLPPGDVKDALATAGVRGWGCVPLIGPQVVQGIMGFDAFRPGWGRVFPAPVMRLAGDVVANAIERDLLERDRTRLMMRLERARRMQTIGSLASGIAHNFNNILGAILGYSEMAEPQLTPGSTPVQHIDEIRRAAERGRDLIDSILTFGGQRDARVRPVRVRDLVEEAASMLRASLPQGIELALGDIPFQYVVSGRSAQLQQVIINLCTNASQAMEGNGRISLSAEQRDLAIPHALSHGELTPGNYVCLAVSDTGQGFSEDVARHLFEPFFTTRNAGTGLGLATVREIVREHDGTMNVQSTPGRGSLFEAWLPAISTDTPVEAPEEKATMLPLGRGETILVIDIDRDRLLGNEEMLAALGYEPVGFWQLADALAACRAEPERFDAVVLSYSSTAPELLQIPPTLRALLSHQPILLATSSTADLGLDALTEAGVAEILRRPLVSTEVAAALARCLRLPAMLRK
jgi:signal transduction histidine kinase